MRKSLTASAIVLLVVVLAACPLLTSPDAKLTGKKFTGSYSGTKSGVWQCDMADESNCHGTWTVNEVSCTLTMAVQSGKSGGGSISCGTGYGTVSNSLSGLNLTGTWFGSFPVAGASGATANYSGSLSGSTGGSSSSSSSSSASLVGTWDLVVGTQLLARQTFGSNGIGSARTWSQGAPQLDGAYVEYNYTSTASSYTTTATYYLLCDFNKGQWVTGPLPPVKTGTIAVTNGGSTLTFDNKYVYTKSSGAITRPSIGGSCTKL
jgi:hypothetical protein